MNASNLYCTVLKCNPPAFFSRQISRVNDLNAIHCQINSCLWFTVIPDGLGEIREFLKETTEPVLISARAVDALAHFVDLCV